MVKLEYARKVMNLMKRASGILMPITSLPTPYGIGTIGKAAYEFADFLKKAGQSYWQILDRKSVV